MGSDSEADAIPAHPAKVFIVSRKFSDGAKVVYGVFSRLERAKRFCAARFESDGIWEAVSTPVEEIHRRGRCDLIEVFEVDGATR